MAQAEPIPGAVKSAIRDGMRIDWDVPIEMDDGLVVRADVFRPVEDGAWPVIASYGPYAKGLTFEAGYPRQWRRLVESYPDAVEGTSGRYAAWELVDPEQWIPNGYAVVRVDSRGAGRSPGHVDVWSSREARDYHDCIEWVGVQPWSNGRVGLAGISYYAKNQWQVAALRPPHLAAICPWEGANDYYRDMTHHGGIHNAFLPDWYERMATIQHGVGSRGFRNPESGLNAAGDEDLSDEQLAARREDLARQILEHPFDDDWHADHSGRPELIEVPVLSAGNWGGLGNHQRGNLLAWEAVRGDRWLEMHGGTHWAGFYTAYGRTLQRRFFDRFLKGTGDWDQQAPVSLLVRSVDGSLAPRRESEWPLARTRWTDAYLDPSSAALSAAPPTKSSSRAYDAAGRGLTFRTPPLGEQTELTGPLCARLWISSSTSDADLFLTLRAFGPDGGEVLFAGANDPRTPLAQGWLRASHRAVDPTRSTPWRPWHPHLLAEPLQPDVVVPVDVEIWATCVVLPAGFRLALTVAGRDFEHDGDPVQLGGRPMRGSGPFLHEHPMDRPADVFDNTVTLHTSPQRASFLRLPVVDGRPFSTSVADRA